MSSETLVSAGLVIEKKKKKRKWGEEDYGTEERGKNARVAKCNNFLLLLFNFFYNNYQFIFICPFLLYPRRGRERREKRENNYNAKRKRRIIRLRDKLNMRKRKDKRYDN
jgi:hypothetical protein